MTKSGNVQEPIRILHVITRLVRGGAQQVVQQLTERIDRNRFEVSVACGEQDGGMVGALEQICSVRRIPHLVREIAPFRDLKALTALFLGFRPRPHVVHAHTYKAGVLASIAARRARVPAIVFTPHGHIFTPGARIPNVPQGLKLRALKSLTRYAQSCADVVTALSREDLEEQLSHRLSPASKYRIIRNGIDIAKFSAGRRDEIRRHLEFNGSPVIGSIGRLTEEKGHRHLIPMLERLPRVRLAIVGAGPERDAILREARQCGVEDRVRLLGEIDSYKVLPGLDVYVQPSLYESQGLAILEAMAAGIPVVATKVGGVGGVVQNGRTGLLVPAADPEAMAAGVRRLLEDRALAQSVVDAARTQVAADFSVERMVRDYEDLYRSLLRRAGHHV